MTHLCSNDEKWKITMEAYDNKTKELTPMRMLIEHMPGLNIIATSCMFVTYFALFECKF